MFFRVYMKAGANWRNEEKRGTLEWHLPLSLLMEHLPHLTENLQ